MMSDPAERGTMVAAVLYTTEEVASELGTYAKLIAHLAGVHAIPFRTAARGRITLFDREAVERLRGHVEAWKNRPRIAAPGRPSPAA